ncbi:MAG: hypothetical protein WD406_00860 [Pseudohongiellaceae bacterium]
MYDDDKEEDAPENGFDKSIRVASDWLYWIETLGKGGTINFLDQTLSRYRRHDNITKSSRFLTQNEIDSLNTCNILLKKYRQNSQDAY